MITLTLSGTAATEALGARLAAYAAVPCVIYLRGELGAGKTTLVRGFLRAFGHQGMVRSPTYTLVEPYQVAGKEIIHIDLYRLGDAEEIEMLGLRDCLDGDAILLIEWPERGEGVLPGADLDICLEHAADARLCHLRGITPVGLAMLRETGI